MTDDLQAALHHVFARPELLAEALTHRSVRHPRLRSHARRPGMSYERLEFLGDRVLGLVVAELLLAQFPAEPEGALARRHAELVRKETLAAVAGEVDLARHVRLPAIEEKSARSNPSLLADVCEAVIAALYLDGGMAVARAFILRHWTDRMAATLKPPKDPKTSLQEWAQARGLPLPEYRLVAAEGPPHQPRFTVGVAVAGRPEATATGTSKRLAETDAAAALLQTIAESGS